MSAKKFLSGVAIAALAAVVVNAQTPAPKLPASPDGRAQVSVGGKWVTPAGANAEPAYQGGKWIEITYSRPGLKGRTNIFGAGKDYGTTVNAGAPVWRAGANVSTRLRTEVPLVIGGKTVAPGEYSVFIELKEGAWTFILSNWAAQTTYDPNNKAALWGAYNYTPDKDVLRVPMKLSKNAMSVEQLTWGFVNMTATGGELAIMWDKESASVPFTLG
jgi:hypothetical protein